MRPILVIWFATLSASVALGQGIVSLKPELVRRVSVGKDPGQLGYAEGGAGSYLGPGRLTVNDARLYFPDTLNGRVNIYDLDWQYVGVLDLSGSGRQDLNHAQSLSFFDNGDFLCWTNAANLVRLTPNGDRVYSIGYQQLYPAAFTSGDYWIWQDSVLYYDGTGEVRAIDESGRFLHGDALKQLLESMKQGSELRHISAGLRSLIDDFVASNGLILYGDRLLTRDHSKLTAFFRLIHDITQSQGSVAALAGVTVWSLRGALYTPDIGMYRLAPGNSETGGYYAFLRDDGSIVQRFTLDIGDEQAASVQAITLRGTIANNGDIYGYDLDGKHWPYTFRFFRLHTQLRWAPVADGVGSISSSSTLSELDDKNAYHAVKLFDGDPKTMWIENAKGPGIGESITVGFDVPVTTDEIQFMPGAFWKEYWKQNYRVKSLEVRLDDKVFTASFKDEMTVQSLKLSSPVTFKTAVFTIKDVYPTTKWEDTAISEITFYNQGAKIEVDYSKFKEFLKKTP